MNAAQDTEFLTEMVKAYVPEATQLSWGEAVELALTRDILAADQLSEMVETQLNLEAAAAAVHDDSAQFPEVVIIGSLTGYTN